MSSTSAATTGTGTGRERWDRIMVGNYGTPPVTFVRGSGTELFDEDGKLDRGDYMTISFDPGFDPEKWDPETDITLDEFEE